ncbi:MAG: hypothetical protein EHM42_13580 [Planctomycetaceae bacterium]|nr:MAG: hypothetical protein EHM42_13580 [Planctomycetaceae bacterium]
MIQADQQQRAAVRRAKLEAQAAFVQKTRQQIAAGIERSNDPDATAALTGSIRPALLQQRRQQYENEMARRRVARNQTASMVRPG